jgi:DnaJ homologue, subfamily C, member 28, conserved domain
MSFSHIAENRIRKAIVEGEFDNLSNAGQPLNLEEYFRAPADLRWRTRF